MSSQSSILELHSEVRSKFDQAKNGKIVALRTKSNNEVLDCLLSMKTEKIGTIRTGEMIQIVVSEPVKQQNRVGISDFFFEKCIGKGGSASVYLVRHKENGQAYALKQIEKSYFVDFKKLQQVLRQRKIMVEMINDFPFTSQLIASFESQKHLNFLLEFYPGGQLFFHLQMRRFQQEEAKLYFCQMVLTFEFLHQRKIVYRDLKVKNIITQPENIIIDINGHSKLADFGLCKLNLQKEDLTFSYCGSVEYMAPQVKDSGGYNYSVDFYTLGAFLYEMVLGVPPYYNNQPLFFPKQMSAEFVELVSKLIELNMNKRLNSFHSIKTSKWLRNIDWNKVLAKQYNMPLKVDPYTSYIHDEFQILSVDTMNAEVEKKYDQLFQAFYFIKDCPNGIVKSYNQKKNRTESTSKKSKSKIKVNKKSNSFRSKQAKKHSKSKGISAKSTEKVNIYTHKKRQTEKNKALYSELKENTKASSPQPKQRQNGKMTMKKVQSGSIKINSVLLK